MDDLLEHAAPVLAARLSRVATLAPEDGRNTVVRAEVADGPLAGRTVIVKQPRGYLRPDPEPDVRRRFFQEATAGLLLTRLAPGDHLPLCHGVDPQHGVMVFDDLGSGTDLAGALLGADRLRAERTLAGYVGALGGLHAATAGRLSSWDEVVAELGGPPELAGCRVFDEHAESLDRGLRGLETQLAELGLPELDAAVHGELEAVRTEIGGPNAFTVLVHRDSCPDNVIATEQGVRLIDFEAARPGHALIDGLYPQLPFPTCWCCNRLPAALVARLTASYRSQLITGVPEAADDAVWDRAVAHVLGYWLVYSFAWVFEGTVAGSRTWGIAGTRARELSRLESFVTETARTGWLPHLRRRAEQLHAELRRRWTTDEPLPLYPVFRSGRAG